MSIEKLVKDSEQIKALMEENLEQRKGFIAESERVQNELNTALTQDEVDQDIELINNLKGQLLEITTDENSYVEKYGKLMGRMKRVEDKVKNYVPKMPVADLIRQPKPKPEPEIVIPPTPRPKRNHQQKAVADKKVKNDGAAVRTRQDDTVQGKGAPCRGMINTGGRFVRN